MGAGRPSRRTGHRRPVKGQRGRCPTGKTRYRTLSDAAATAAARQTQVNYDLYVYECPKCRGAHITHLTPEAYQTAREGGWATGSDR